jgi:hypothetical protein
VGEIYDDPKTVQVICLMTPDGKLLLDELARSFGVSRSELLEQIARGKLGIIRL